MYEVLCERCWRIEPVQGDRKPDYACPDCGASAWLGPFAETPASVSPRDGWPLLTSPLYAHAGQADRRANPR